MRLKVFSARKQTYRTNSILLPMTRALLVTSDYQGLEAYRDNLA